MGSKLYGFPFKPNEENEVTLYTMKMLKFFKLLSSNESKCVYYDSEFQVIRPQKEAFEV